MSKVSQKLCGRADAGELLDYGEGSRDGENEMSEEKITLGSCWVGTMWDCSSAGWCLRRRRVSLECVAWLVE